MKTASLDTLSNDIIKPGMEKFLVPLALYRGANTLGAVHRKWNFAIAMMHSECENFSEAVKASNNPEFSHLCEPVTRVQHLTMRSFFGRLNDHPEVTNNIPGLTEYARYMGGFSSLQKVPLVDARRRSSVPWRVWADAKPRGRKPGTIIKVQAKDLFYPYCIHKPKEKDEAYDLMQLVNSAVPKGLPDFIRADICQDMIVGILSGDISREEIAHNYKDFARKVFEMHPQKYGHISLDAPVPGTDGGMTYMDAIGSNV